jgi:hypothetical protein
LLTYWQRYIVGAFTEFRVIHEEKFRFQYLVDSLQGNEEEDSTSIEYKAAGLSLINAIVNSPDIIEERILLREEFERREIDYVFKVNLFNSFSEDKVSPILSVIYILGHQSFRPSGICIKTN